MGPLNGKIILLVLSLTMLLALTGCGGGSDSTSPVATQPNASSGATTAKRPASAPHDKAKKRPSGKEQGQAKPNRAKTSKSPEEKAHDLVKKLADSGKPVDADSPAAKKLIQALTEGKSSNQSKDGQKKPSAVEKALEHVVSPKGANDGSGGGSSGAQGGSGGSVGKILEQLQE